MPQQNETKKGRYRRTAINRGNAFFSVERQINLLPTLCLRARNFFLEVLRAVCPLVSILTDSPVW